MTIWLIFDFWFNRIQESPHTYIETNLFQDKSLGFL